MSMLVVVMLSFVKKKENKGFPKMDSWVIQCIITPSFRVNVNGKTGQAFKSKISIRQGDYIYPYIFIVCVEYLARYIHHMSLNSLV